MPIPAMRFEEAVRIFLRYDEQVLSSRDYCPENIYQSQLGHGPINSRHAVPADLRTLVGFINDILRDNDMVEDLKKVCTDRRYQELSENRHEMRTMADILTPNLIQNIKIKLRHLGTQSRLDQIIFQCPALFIRDLFDALSRRHISLPRDVEQFYHALYNLSVRYIFRVYGGTLGDFEDTIKKLYSR